MSTSGSSGSGSGSDEDKKENRAPKYPLQRQERKKFRRRGLKRMDAMQQLTNLPLDVDAAVRSAILYFAITDDFFKSRTKEGLSSFPYLELNLQSQQLADADAAITGRLFNQLDLYLSERVSVSGAKERQSIDARRDLDDRGNKLFDFTSIILADRLYDIAKQHSSPKEIDNVLNLLAQSIQENKLWVEYWSAPERLSFGSKIISANEVDKPLINHCLDTLIYKMAGDAHAALIAKYKPSAEEQQAMQRTINSFKTAAKNVTPDTLHRNLESKLPSIAATSGSHAPAHPTAFSRQESIEMSLQALEDKIEAVYQGFQRKKPTETGPTSSSSSAPADATPKPLTRVQAMAQRYDRNVKKLEKDARKQGSHQKLPNSSSPSQKGPGRTKT